ncbi:MAG: hypothetical protein C4530_20730 [Desulfobacteraceae bacterium]|nr:MAG: hypothetical protein C4530_20730 [Desulfobacteraceae bacterium]
MIFLAATEPNVDLTVYDAKFILQPLTYPEINTDHILAMENEMGRRILQRSDGKLKKIHFDAQRLPGFPKPLTPGMRVPPGSRILVIRGGGIGDVLMCVPAFREIRRRLHPETHLSLASFACHKPLFSAIPYLDSVIAQPLTLNELMTADYIVEFSGCSGSMSSTHMIDFYLEQIGLNPLDIPDKSIELSVESLQDERVANWFRQNRSRYRRLVYLNGLASDPLRDLPPEVLALFPREFQDSLFIIPNGYLNRYPEKCAGLTSPSNVLALDTEDSLTAYVTALHQSDCIVTTDSSAYHIAAALGKPCMALFGPIASRLRTVYYQTVYALEADYLGKTCRSPCGKSMFSEFYAGSVNGAKRCPEAKERNSVFSPCLSAFSSKALFETFNTRLRGG